MTGRSGPDEDVWVFGYGSLIWRPDMPVLESRVARLDGWMRRFWQGSHDHRGIPESPGRVVTLIERAGHSCEGLAFRIDSQTAHDTFAALDYREKNGYERRDVELHCRDGSRVQALVYIAVEGNFAYLGPANDADIASQIQSSTGPSGRNIDYLLELARALREHGIDDPHVFGLEALLATSQSDTG